MRLIGLLADLKDTNVDHAVFMRVIDREKEVRYQPGYAWYPGFYDDPFFGYDDPGYYWVDTIVSVETLIYSVPDSRLVWTGLSRTINPSEVDDFVKELVSGAVKEMKKTGFFPG